MLTSSVKARNDEYKEKYKIKQEKDPSLQLLME
jgi:hypothetical protein